MAEKQEAAGECISVIRATLRATESFNTTLDYHTQSTDGQLLNINHRRRTQTGNTKTDKEDKNIHKNAEDK